MNSAVNPSAGYSNPSDAPINVAKKEFYNSAGESGCSRFLRLARCGCFSTKYVINTELVRWETCGCSGMVSDSVDVDAIRDISLQQRLSLGYCFRGQGTLRLYIEDSVGGKKTERVIALKNIEHANDVLQEFSAHVHAINNLKYGMNRPQLKDTPHLMYDSAADPFCVKLLRTGLCCGCWCFPHTIVSKERIITTSWTATCAKQTQQFDLDNVQDVQMNRPLYSLCCCGAGNIVIVGTDSDQNGMTIRAVAHSPEVFRKLDEATKTLNNRGRVLGEQGMNR